MAFRQMPWFAMSHVCCSVSAIGLAKYHKRAGVLDGYERAVDYLVSRIAGPLQRYHGGCRVYNTLDSEVGVNRNIFINSSQIEFGRREPSTITDGFNMSIPVATYDSHNTMG